MIVDLPSTTTTAVSKRLVELRNNVGAMAMTRVLTLVAVVGETSADAAIETATRASRQHPARIVVLVSGNRRGSNRLDAQIRVGGDAGASEIVVLRLYGELAEHGDSVLIPLLLPDSPIVAWWPEEAPADVADSPVGAMAHRRITDASGAARPAAALRRRAEHYTPGDTDLAWTRITRWRGLLAAALDQPPYQPVEAASVTAEPDHPGAALLAGWLAAMLDVPVTRVRSGAGTGLVAVRLQRPRGPVDLTRVDEALATLQAPGQPDRLVTLSAPGLPECLAEELRRLDPDEVYAEALTKGLSRVGRRAIPRVEAAAKGKALRTAPPPPDTPGPIMSSRALAQRQPTDGPVDETVLAQRVEQAMTQQVAPRQRVFDTSSALADEVARALVRVVGEAVEAEGVAHVSLTGGTMGQATVAALVTLRPPRKVWRKVHLWWGDERFVPAGDPDRNDQQADDAGLGDLPVPAAQVHRVPAGSGEAGLDAAAAAYALELARHAPALDAEAGQTVAVPRFTVMLLGLGQDTHVASLFPGQPGLGARDASTVAVPDSPKPPPLRVSLTVPALNAADRVWFVVAGSDKAPAVRRGQSSRDDEQVPASWVRGRSETVWWLDRAAAGEG